MSAVESLAATAPERQRAKRRDAAAEHEPRDPGRDQHLRLVLAQLRAPVGQPRDLHPELLDRGTELHPVGLDRGAELLGRALDGDPGCHQSSPPGATVARIFFASSIARSGVGGPALSLRHANRNANMAIASSRMNTIAKPYQRLENSEFRPQASVSRPNTTANTPNTAPAAAAAAPRAMPVAFCVTSTLASSISSRTSSETRSETSATAVARLSGSAGKALEDQGEHQPAGERGPEGELGTGLEHALARGLLGRGPGGGRLDGSGGYRWFGERGAGRVGRRPARSPRGWARARARVPEPGWVPRGPPRHPLRRAHRTPPPPTRRRSVARPLAQRSRAARSLGRIFAEYARIDHRRHPRGGNARERADSG